MATGYIRLVTLNNTQAARINTNFWPCPPTGKRIGRRWERCI